MKTKIIYEDKDVLVIHKPAGLATQTAKIGQADVVSELKNYLMLHSKEAKSTKPISSKQQNREPYLGVIHRLDQPVEGLLVFAKSKETAAKLTAQLSKGTLNKEYYAVICGQPTTDRGELVDYMYKDANSHAQVVTGQQDKYPEAKRAVLQYKLVKNATTMEGNCAPTGTVSVVTDDNESTAIVYSLMDIHIETGRFHQIRAQMAHAGMALLGDSKYGDEITMSKSRELGIRNVALCAYKIDFPHPVTNKVLSFTVQPEGNGFSYFFQP